MTFDLAVARQMVAAEILRLWRKRSMVVIVLAVTLVPLMFSIGYDVIRHVSDSRHDGPAGGVRNFTLWLDVLAVFIGPVTGALIGGESGAADLASGVFRDQVVTGRSRLALFVVKVPAVVAVAVAAAVPALVMSIGSAYAFAGNLATPDLALVLQSSLWMALSVSAVSLVALGFASLTGSRPATIALSIAWAVVISPNLAQVNSLGGVREGLLDVALVFLRPGPAVGNVPTLAMSVAVALAVLAGWLLVFLGVGAWRTQTRDA